MVPPIVFRESGPPLANTFFFYELIVYEEYDFYFLVGLVAPDVFVVCCEAYKED